MGPERTDGEPTSAEKQQPLPSTRDVLPLREATRTWFAISLQTFGGPAGQIAVMQRTLVDEKRWIGQGRFLHALNYCMLLPGPEAQQLAIYIGWLLNGIYGGLIAGTLFVLPGAVALLVLSALYVGVRRHRRRRRAFPGAGSCGHRHRHPGRRPGQQPSADRPRPGRAGCGGLHRIGVLRGPVPDRHPRRRAPRMAAGPDRPVPGDVRKPAPPDNGPAPLIADDQLHHERGSTRRWITILVVGLVLWFTPVLLAAALFGRDSVFVEQGLFFSGAAVVTFGGAYAVLAYVAQQAVNVYDWLLPNEMVKGLALAETTPGPLIMVVQFVAFLGAYRNPGSLNPWAAAVIASLLVTWVTFVPCFLFILLGAPYVERLRHNTNLSAALTGITAAVVGVIASLAAFFAVHTLFDQTRQITAGPFDFQAPVWQSIQWDAVAVMVLGCYLIFRRRWSVLRTLGACALTGIALSILGAVVR